jgi:hypothetical protein
VETPEISSENIYTASEQNEENLVVSSSIDSIFRENNQIARETADILPKSIDCEVPDRKILLKSKGQKKDFSLILALCENFESGYVLYDGQTEHIPIQFDHEKIVEDRSEEGRPNVRDLFYNEIYRGKINGSYVLTVQGARFYGASYIRKKDNKTIDLEVINDIYE